MIRCYFNILLMTALGLLLSSGCSTLPKDFDKSETYAYLDTDSTSLGSVRREEMNNHFGQSGFRLLKNGLDAFVARAVLSQKAERSLDVQYYLYHDDLVGALFTDQLFKAADRGVRVRVLVDDMGFADRDMGISVLDSHPHIEVRIFNPFSRNSGRALQLLTRMGSVTRRMHNKTFTVDNQVSILGGRNIGNEYFEADPDIAFTDLDVLAIGPVAKEVSTSFDKYWNSELSYPISVLIDKPPKTQEIQQKRHELNKFIESQADSEYLHALQNSILAREIRNNEMTFCWGEADIIYDQPEKVLKDFDQTEYHLSPQLIPYWESVKKELIILSPYFVPGKPGVAFLTQLAKRGIQVRILTNSLSSNDVGIVHAGYAKYRKDLLRVGVELYELNMALTREQRKDKKGEGSSSKASLHAKSFVFDRKQIFIGSLNLDPRSLVHNTEIGVVISSKETAGEMGGWFDQDINRIAFRLELIKTDNGREQIIWHGLVDGKEQILEVEPYTGFWRRFGIGLMGILPIESQL